MILIQEVNSYLRDYHSLHQYPSVWIVLDAVDVSNCVYRWREEAERERRERGEDAMTPDQVPHFIRYIHNYL